MSGHSWKGERVGHLCPCLRKMRGGFEKCQLLYSPGKVCGGFSGGQKLVALDWHLTTSYHSESIGNKTVDNFAEAPLGLSEELLEREECLSSAWGSVQQSYSVANIEGVLIT